MIRIIILPKTNQLLQNSFLFPFKSAISMSEDNLETDKVKCTKTTGFWSVFKKEDAVDRFPGMKSWKAISAVLILVAIGLITIGFISRSIGDVSKYPINNISLQNKVTNKEYGHAWNWIHFFGYYLMSVLFPDSWLLLWLLGAAWETTEIFLGWGDPMDIIFNTAGIALGVLTRKVLVPLADKAVSTNNCNAHT